MRYAIPALVVMLLSPLSRAAEGMWLLEALPPATRTQRFDEVLAWCERELSRSPSLSHTTDRVA